MRVLKKILTYPILALAAIVLLFEEWLWDDVIALFNRMAHWRAVRAVESWITTLPPYAALAFFLVPMLTLLPIKVLALYLIAHGHGMSGISVILTAKLVGTATAARLYYLTSHKLLQIGWFARFHAWFMAKKQNLLAWLAAQPSWIAIKTAIGTLRQLLTSQTKSALQKRWAAATRRLKARCCLLPR